jgi:hypothetical protein
MYNFRDYIGFAENYIALAEIETGNAHRLLIPSILLAWVAIESFVNNMLDDFASLPPDLFELHERALLLEKQVVFVDEGANKGKFILEKTEYRRIEEKIFFMLAKFGKDAELSKGDKLWQDFDKLKELRNNLMHPRKNLELTIDVDVAKQSLESAKRIIEFVARHVWGKTIEV